MSLWNTIEFAHMTLCLVPKVLNAIDVILLVCKKLRVVDPEVFEVGNIQHVIPPPTIGIDDAVRHELTRHDREQRGAGGIRDNLRVDPSSSLQ